MTHDAGLDIECRELVELVTDFLEGTLDDGRRLVIEAHLALCPGCATYVEQMWLTAQALGHVPLAVATGLPDEVRENLLAAFRAEH